MIALSCLLVLLAFFCIGAAIALQAAIAQLRDDVSEHVSRVRQDAMASDDINSSEASERCIRLAEKAGERIDRSNARQESLARTLGYSWHADQSSGKYLKDKKAK